jgi:hypothetical protein
LRVLLSVEKPNDQLRRQPPNIAAYGAVRLELILANMDVFVVIKSSGIAFASIPTPPLKSSTKNAVEWILGLLLIMTIGTKT